MHVSLVIYVYRLHTNGEVAKSLGNQAGGAQSACTMTIQNSKIRLISSIALKSRLITSYQPAIGKSHWSIQTGHSTN